MSISIFNDWVAFTNSKTQGPIFIANDCQLAQSKSTRQLFVLLGINQKVLLLFDVTKHSDLFLKLNKYSTLGKKPY